MERRTARGGRDSIDHPPGAHDDLINAVAALCAVQHEFGGYDLSGFQPDFVDRDANIVSGCTSALADALHAYVALHQRWW